MKKLAKIFRKGFLTIFLVIAACFCFSSPSLAFGPSNDIILNGIDISDWQGDIEMCIRDRGKYLRLSQKVPNNSILSRSLM